MNQVQNNEISDVFILACDSKSLGTLSYPTVKAF